MILFVGLLGLTLVLDPHILDQANVAIQGGFYFLSHLSGDGVIGGIGIILIVVALIAGFCYLFIEK